MLLLPPEGLEFYKFSEVSGKYAFGLMEKLVVKLDLWSLMNYRGPGKDYPTLILFGRKYYANPVKNVTWIFLCIFAWEVWFGSKMRPNPHGKSHHFLRKYLGNSMT